MMEWPDGEDAGSSGAEPSGGDRAAGSADGRGSSSGRRPDRQGGGRRDGRHRPDAADGERRRSGGGGRAGAGSRRDVTAGRKGKPTAGRSRPGGEQGKNARGAAPARVERIEEPVIEEDVSAGDLDEDVRGQFTGLPGEVATAVARHLVMAGRLLEEDPERAYEHAKAARRRANRIGVIREAAGIAAYRSGRYAEALAELRAARRMTGSAEYLPMMADCERGMGRPLRALDLAADPAVTGLETASRMEMLIVAAGARRDLGQHAAAAAMLQVPELRSKSTREWVARLRYAYADALEAAGREGEARRWFARAAEVDIDGETDAAERADSAS